MKELILAEWYDALIDELRSTITQRVKRSREELIIGYYEVGERLLEEYDRFERSGIYGDEIVQRVANSLGLGTRTIYNAISLVEKFPDFEDIFRLKEGENISWHKLCNKYLPDNKRERKPKEITCPNCNYVFKLEEVNK